jgi:indolepyruvate ferredoxin oxidoreductase
LLAPPLLARRDRKSGQIRKMTFGPWIFPVLARLARFKTLRGTRWDVFGRTEERRTERALIGEYEAIVDELIRRLQPDTHAASIAIAEVPARIRGYGRVKEPTVADARSQWLQLLTALRAGRPVSAVAAE